MACTPPVIIPVAGPLPSSPNFGTPPGTLGRGGQIVRAIVLHSVNVPTAGVDAAALTNQTLSLVQADHDVFHYFVDGSTIRQYVDDANMAWSLQRYGIGVTPAPVFFPPGSTFPLTVTFPLNYVDSYVLHVAVSTGALGIVATDRCGQTSCVLPAETENTLSNLLCCLLTTYGLTAADVFTHNDVDPLNGDFPACFSIANLRVAITDCLTSPVLPVPLCAAPLYNPLLPFLGLGCQLGQIVQYPPGGAAAVYLNCAGAPINPVTDRLVLCPAVPGNCASAPDRFAIGAAGALVPVTGTRPTISGASGAGAPVSSDQLIVGTGNLTLTPPTAPCVFAKVTVKNGTALPLTVTATVDGVAATVITLAGTNAFGSAWGESVDLEWVAALNTYVLH